MESDLLRSINQLWLKRKKIAEEYRTREYDPIVKKIDRYYHSRKRWLFINLGTDPDEEPFPTSRPFHRISIAKTGEFVRVMLPYIFFQVPVRTCTPRARHIPDDVKQAIFSALNPMAAQMIQTGMPIPDPMAPLLEIGKIQSFLSAYMLNYAADEATYNLRGQSRKAIQDALISGRGLLWHELIQTPNGYFPGSFFESQYNLLVDPDHDDISDANFIIRKRRQPAWEVAEKFGLPFDKIRAHAKSHEQLASEEVSPRAYSVEDQKDLCEYVEIYSRMGIGQRFENDDSTRKRLEAAAESIGDYVYLACMEGMDHPLNLDPDRMATMSDQDLIRALSWPIAFYGDRNDPWPFSRLDFYEDGIYPKAPLEDALPLQAFLDFAYFWLMQRIKATGRSIYLVQQSIGAKFKQALESAMDLEIVELTERFPEVGKLFEQLTFEEVNTDLWKIIEAVDQKWEDSTGVNALVRGGTPDKMMRSSAEAQFRQTNSQIRPDDLRDCVQSWQGTVARKEHIAQRLVMREDIATYFGEQPPGKKANVPMGMMTEAWMKFIATDDYWTAAQEIAVDIQGSTGRRRNKETQMANLQEIAQLFLPVYTQWFQQTGDPSKINAFQDEFYDALDVADPSVFQFPVQQAMPPQIPEGPVPGGPGEPQQGPEQSPEDQGYGG